MHSFNNNLEVIWLWNNIKDLQLIQWVSIGKIGPRYVKFLFFYQCKFIHDGWVYIDATNTKLPHLLNKMKLPTWWGFDSFQSDQARIVCKVSSVIFWSHIIYKCSCYWFPFACSFVVWINSLRLPKLWFSFGNQLKNNYSRYVGQLWA